MRKNRYPYSDDRPSTFRVAAYTFAIAIIAIKTFGSICRMLSKTAYELADSRQSKA